MIKSELFMMAKKSRIISRNLIKSFNNRKILNDISLQVDQGEVVGLLGPNGAGKTTTFRILLGFIRPEGGSVYFNDIDITEIPVHKRVRYGISYLPQEPSIFKNLTVMKNLIAIYEMIPLEKRKCSIESVIEEMGLEDLKERKAFKLSGGERRRLEIARALLLSPFFLLLDEPFAGIDPIQISELHKLILKLKEKGLGVIITDHNVREILKITDRSYIINRGKIIFEGDSKELISNERVKDEYLGNQFRWN
jgi:lipopolysaccharide export system ATP-binding protein